jgi:hypothetical protein
MQPRETARATSFGPDDLRKIFAAYDDAWNEIAPMIGTEPAAVESARSELATIVLGLGSANVLRPDRLSTTAVAVFCSKHRIGNGRAA